MAQWSEKRAEYEKEQKLAATSAQAQSTLAERAELFKKFRDGGYSIWVVTPDDHRFVLDKTVILKDNHVGTVHFGVKMPGAYPMRIKTITQLYRLAKGLV